MDASHRPPERIEPMIELLREAWQLVPNWRLTQLVIIATDKTDGTGAVFYMEDDEMERRLKALLAELRNREKRD